MAPNRAVTPESIHPRVRVMPRSLYLVATFVVMGSCTDAPNDPPVSAISEPSIVELNAAEESGEPNLAVSPDGILVSWLEPAPGDSAWDLRVARVEEAEAREPRTVVRRSDFFVNWADFPSVAVLPDGRWAAHWLQRGDAGGYDYGVRVALSADEGRTWSEPWTPHEDGTPTEHGFVTLFPDAGGVGLVWLDGRRYAQGPGGGEPTEEMTLRFRRLGDEGAPAPTRLLDERTCDCCQTDVAVTSSGPVVAYRDRGPDEVRDVYVTRRLESGWSEGRPVHDDGWVIGGCPVNGPVLASRGGDELAAAWFTAAGDVPRVRVAFSGDAGASFGEPVEVDGGNPAGRVDAVLLDDGSALVSWLERLGEGEAEIRVRRVWPDGRLSGPSVLSRSSDARASGFPRMALARDGRLWFAWTRVDEEGRTRVRLATAEVAS